MPSQTRRKPLAGIALFAYALLIAAVALLFTSKCSPLYPLNDWPDANVFLSAGKGMLEGRVMYRDLYDHKGPLLFALHALCALISTEGFLGVWLMEIALFTAFLLIAHRLIALYCSHTAAAWALPLLALMLLTSISFQMGDSAEELALPLMLWPLYRLLFSLRQDEGRTTRWQLRITGFLLGCVFWLKFTLVGIPAAVCLVLAWLGLRKDGLGGAVKNIGWMLLGFGASTLPWIIQYTLQGALLPMLKTYLYDNLFLYAGAEEALTLTAQFKAIARAVLSWLKDNPGYTLPLLLGAAGLMLSKRHSLPEKITWALCGLLGLITVFFGGRYYLYYGFAFGAMVPLFFAVALGALSAHTSALPPVRAKPGTALCMGCLAVCTALCLLLCPLLSPNKPLEQPPKEELMQYRFAAIIRQYENATLLNYNFLDWGFYTAAEVAPHLKYYHLPNMPLPELHSEQQRYVREGLSDFVVTRAPLSSELGSLYTLADTCPAPEGLWFTDVYLYRLNTLEAK